MDIKPFVDPKFENNVILTGTEFLTMNTRPKDRAADYKRMYKVQEVKPRTIAQQMKEAAKLAEADRGRAAPKKTTPDRGDR